MKSSKNLLFLILIILLFISCSGNDGYDGRISGEFKLKSTSYAPFPEDRVITVKFNENNLELFQDGILTMEAKLCYIDTQGSLLVFEINRNYKDQKNDYNLGYSEEMKAYKFGNSGEIYLTDLCYWPDPPAGSDCYRYNFIRI